MGDWQDISTAPMDGTPVLAHLSDSGNLITVQWAGGRWAWKSVEHDQLWSQCIVTHWMPLPSPPVTP